MENRKASSALNVWCWPGEAIGRLIRNGTFSCWVGVHICLSLVNFELEAGTKIRKVVSYLLIPSQLGLIFICVIIWLSALFDRDSGLIFYKSDRESKLVYWTDCCRLC